MSAAMKDEMARVYICSVQNNQKMQKLKMKNIYHKNAGKKLILLFRKNCL